MCNQIKQNQFLEIFVSNSDETTHHALKTINYLSVLNLYLAEILSHFGLELFDVQADSTCSSSYGVKLCKNEGIGVKFRTE